MRHQLVGRAVLVLLALATGASLWFARRGATRAVSAPAPSAAPSQSGSPPTADARPDEGALLYARHCAGCHEPEELLEDLGEGEARERALAAVLALLAEHGASSPEEDLRIVAHLRALADEGR